MPDNKPAPDPNKKPRRALTAEERAEIFREFKLGLIAVAVLILLLVTLCWDRGEKSAGASARAQELQRANMHVRLMDLPRPPSFDRNPGTEGGRGDLPPVPPNRIGQPPAPVHGVPNQPPPPPVVVPPAPPQPRFRDYTVQKGDSSLWKIASRTMGSGSRWPLIKEANPGLDPARMKIGQVLRIPLPSARPPASAPTAPTTGAFVSMTTPAPAAPTSPILPCVPHAAAPAVHGPSLELAHVVPIE